MQGGELVSFVKPLAYKELAHTVSAIIDEKSAIIVGSLAVNGPQRVSDIRKNLQSRGVILQPGQLIHDDASGAVRRLEHFGFIETDGGIMHLSNLGNGLGALFTGEMLDYSSIGTRSFGNFWSKVQSVDSKSELIHLPEGTIEYRKRPAELRIKVIEDLIRRSVKKQLPVLVAGLVRGFQEEDVDVNHNRVFNIIDEYAQQDIVSYRPGDGPKEFVKSGTSPEIPPESYAGSQPLTMEFYKYILMAESDEVLSRKGAIEYIFHRFPERRLNNPDHLDKIGRIILNEFCKNGYIELIPPGVSLSVTQRRDLSDLVRRLRSVQDRSPEGFKLLQKLFKDSERLQVLVDKAVKH